MLYSRVTEKKCYVNKLQINKFISYSLSYFCVLAFLIRNSLVWKKRTHCTCFWSYIICVSSTSGTIETVSEPSGQLSHSSLTVFILIVCSLLIDALSVTLITWPWRLVTVLLNPDICATGYEPSFNCCLMALLSWSMLVAGVQDRLRLNPLSLLKFSGCSQISVASLTVQSM
jgi:hypothetical protein